MYSGPSFWFKAFWIAWCSSGVKLAWNKSEMKAINYTRAKLALKLAESIWGLSENLTLPNEPPGALSVLHIMLEYSPVKVRPLFCNFLREKWEHTVRGWKKTLFEICQHWSNDQSKHRICKDLWDLQCSQYHKPIKYSLFIRGSFRGKWRPIRRSCTFVLFS